MKTRSGLAPSTKVIAALAILLAGFATSLLSSSCDVTGIKAGITSTLSVTYASNGSTGGTVPADPTQYRAGQMVIVMGNTGNLVKTDFSFSGWSTKADGTGTEFLPGVTFSMGSANLTLHARWKSSVATPVFSPVMGSYSSDQSVTIGDSTSGATIHYTTDGSEPTLASPTYTGPIAVSGDGKIMIITAFAAMSGMVDSPSVSATYGIVYDRVETPAFSPVTGVYSQDQSVTVTCATKDATIHYTVDGSEPTSASTTYSTAIPVAGDGTSVTVKAMAVKAGMTDSDSGTAAYAINSKQVSTPNFSFSSGTYNSDQSVTISCSTPGAAIFCTTDGTTPTSSSPAYTSAIGVAGDGTMKTIKALATKAGMVDSTITTATYVISSQVATPIISLAAGSYAADQTASISCSTAGSTIYYTIDGGVPTTSSSVYSAALSIAGPNSTTTIKAIASKSGLTASAVASATYVVRYQYSLAIGAGSGGSIATPTSSPLTVNHGASTTITATANGGYAFSGWTVTAGSGVTFGDAVAADTTVALAAGDATIQANFVIPTYGVTYAANGAPLGSPPSDGKAYKKGDQVTVLGNTGNFQKQGYNFAGWTTNPNMTGASSSYAAGATMTMDSGSATLYAIWVPTNLICNATGSDIQITGFGYNLVGSLTVPPGITTISSGAFTNCSGLVGVTLPSSLTTLGFHAFAGCSGLASVTIPPSVVWIEENPFVGCSSLTDIVVDGANPNFSSSSGALFDKTRTTLIEVPCGKAGTFSVPDGVTQIGDRAFSECAVMTGVTLPSSVTTIGRMAFFNCLSLTSVNLSSGLTAMGENAFCLCTALENITLPASLISIGKPLFTGCDALTSISVDASNAKYASSSGALFNKNLTTLIKVPGGKTGTYDIPAGVTSVGEYAFMDCSGITSVSIPSTLTSIGQSAFASFTGLVSVTIPSSVASIGQYAFQSCQNLLNLTLSPGITSINDNAFYYCSSLTSVTIPASVTAIGTSAFAYCAKLESVTMLATTPPLLFYNSGVFNGEAANFKIHVPSGSLSAYTSDGGWNQFAIVSP
ncbi:MAG: leucine-rich repeat protein [Spirochaetota bacterium]